MQNGALGAQQHGHGGTGQLWTTDCYFTTNALKVQSVNRMVLLNFLHFTEAKYRRTRLRGSSLNTLDSTLPYGAPQLPSPCAEERDDAKLGVDLGLALSGFPL